MRVLILAILLLAGCASLGSTQTIQVSDLPVVEESTEEPEVQEEPEVEEKVIQEPINLGPKPLEIIEKNGHIVEIIDITEDEEACLIKVDGVSTIAELDKTTEFGGVTIKVHEIRKFRSLTEKDVCKVTVS